MVDDNPSPLQVALPHARVRITRPVGRVRVVFTGEVDLNLREPFTAITQYVTTIGEPVEADLGEVTFFGAEGIHCLINLHHAVPGGAVTVVAMSAPVATVLQVTSFPNRGAAADPHGHEIDP